MKGEGALDIHSHLHMIDRSALPPTHPPSSHPHTTPTRHTIPPPQNTSSTHHRCFYGAVGGMLLRLADIKRKQATFFANAVRGFFAVTLLFALVLPDALMDPVIVRWAPCCIHILRRDYLCT